MKDIAPLLEELARKLGTTVEYLWQVLLKQAQVEIRLCELWMNIGLFGFGGIAAILFAAWLVGLKRDWDDAGITMLFFLWLIVGAIGGLVYYANYSSFLTVTMNPEYWALKEVLRAVK